MARKPKEKPFSIKTTTSSTAKLNEAIQAKSGKRLKKRSSKLEMYDEERIKNRTPAQKAASERFKAMQKDPEFLAKKDAAIRAKREADPESLKRSGIPNGMNRAQAETFRRRAKEQAKKDIEIMKQKGIISAEDTMANDALEEALAVMRGAHSQPIKLSAAKLILEYTKAKPQAKSEVTVKTAEDWLKEILTKDTSDDDEGEDAE